MNRSQLLHQLLRIMAHDERLSAKERSLALNTFNLFLDVIDYAIVQGQGQRASVQIRLVPEETGAATAPEQKRRAKPPVGQ